MVMLLPQARQAGATESHCLKLPESFPTPRFGFGDWVKTDEDDVGMVVGLTLTRSGPESWWIYDLDLTCDSPNYWSYQGIEPSDSPGMMGYPEYSLISYKIGGE